MSQRNSFWASPVLYVVLIVALIVMVFAMRLSYALQIFSFDSQANAPTIAARQLVFTSTLKKPRRFDFIAFQNVVQGRRSIWLSRLCGMPGDSIEMRDGQLYVNHRCVDSTLTLSHSFVVQTKDTAGLRADTTEVIPADSGQVLITYPDGEIGSHGIAYQRYIVPEDRTDAYMQKVYGQSWNTDHFGPIAVPPDHYFVLGDNRSNAIDSRYLGFISSKDFKGTVLNF